MKVKKFQRYSVKERNLAKQALSKGNKAAVRLNQQNSINYQK
jgi:hypothetical protein